MLRGRGRGIEGGHQEQRGSPQVPKGRGREVIGLVVGHGQRPLARGGQADGVDAVCDQHRLLARVRWAAPAARAPRTGPRARGLRPVCSLSACSAVRTSWAEGLCDPSEASSSDGSRGVAEPGCQSTTAPSIRSRCAKCSANSRAPAAPSLPPSVETNTSVFVCLEVRSLSTSSSRVAVAAALEAAPGPLAESRAASTTTLRGDSPGSVRIRLRSWTSSAVEAAVEALFGDLAFADAVEALLDHVGDGASPSLPGVRSGAASTIWRSILAAASWSNSAEATAGGSGVGPALQREQQYYDCDERRAQRPAR